MEQNNEANREAGTSDEAEPRIPRRQMRRRRRPRRTTAWYHDSVVGTELHNDLTVARFYVSKNPDETPEIFFIPMLRTLSLDAEGKINGYRPSYAGDVERNAIPLSTLDVGLFTKALVDMKSHLLRMKADFHESHGRTPPPEPEPLAPVVIPQPEPQAPVLHRQYVEPEPEKPATTKLADLLRPW